MWSKLITEPISRIHLLNLMVLFFLLFWSSAHMCSSRKQFCLFHTCSLFFFFFFFDWMLCYFYFHHLFLYRDIYFVSCSKIPSIKCPWLSTINRAHTPTGGLCALQALKTFWLCFHKIYCFSTNDFNSIVLSVSHSHLFRFCFVKANSLHRLGV